MFFTFFIPILYFLPLLILQKELSSIGQIEGIEGITITFVGLGIWIAGFLGLGIKSFAVLPKAKVLQTKGIYKYFRHPIYIGITLTLLGLSICLKSWFGFLYTMLVLIPLNIYRAKKEEKVLLEKFGNEYLEYKKKTLI